jgi:hypothetical protein
MSAKIVTVSQDLIWSPEDVQQLWFFPDGSQYLQYSPHFHAIFTNGFRQSFPLMYSFVVVLEGKLSVKEYWGKTQYRINVKDQVWFDRGSGRKVPQIYRKILRNTT